MEKRFDQIPALLPGGSQNTSVFLRQNSRFNEQRRRRRPRRRRTKLRLELPDPAMQPFDAGVKLNDARVQFNDAGVKFNVDRTQLDVRRAQFRDHGNKLVVGRFGEAFVHGRRQRNEPVRAAPPLRPPKIGGTVNSYRLSNARSAGELKSEIKS